MKQQLKEKLTTLTGLIGVSGSEHQVIRYCRDYLEPLADEVTVLPCGDCIAKFDSGKPGPKMMIAAHADEIGFHIRSIDKNGFIYFGVFGGVQLKTVLASRVLFNGKKGVVKGIVGLTPGHITPPEERSKVPAMDACYIDVGASSDEEGYEMGLEIGSTAVVESPLTELNKPDLVTGRCIDDRAGCAALLQLAEAINAGEITFEGSIYITITVQEETGLLGAIHASEAVKPDCFIAVDTAPCGGAPASHEDGRRPHHHHQRQHQPGVQDFPQPGTGGLCQEVRGGKRDPAAACARSGCRKQRRRCGQLCGQPLPGHGPGDAAPLFPLRLRGDGLKRPGVRIPYAGRLYPEQRQTEL